MANSPLASPSATLSVLKRHGLWTRASLGQHFLVDDNVIARIMALSDVAADQTVLEVGPGIGTLTIPLCEVAGAVVAVEADPALVPVLAETTAQCRRLAILQADVLDLSPSDLGAPFGAPDKLVANLPYGVAATLVLRAFEEMPSIRSATVMVQAEVADRMAASTGTKNYGSYTVKLQLRADVADRFPVSRSSFLPPPRVDSSVIRLDRRVPVVDGDVVERAAILADAAFAQRRKTIRNSLLAASGELPERVDAALSAAGIDPGVRAETLAPERFLDLARALPAS